MKEIKKKFKTYYDEENLSLKLDHFILFEMALMLVVYFRKDADSNKGYILFTKYHNIGNGNILRILMLFRMQAFV